MELYHSDIRLPQGFKMPTARVNLKWTKHASHARQADRYGMIPQFENIPLSQFSVVEVGVNGGRVEKVVIRGHFDNTRDVVFVLIPGPQSYTVKTVWFNLRSDKHSTLDRSKYVA